MLTVDIVEKIVEERESLGSRDRLTRLIFGDPSAKSRRMSEPGVAPPSLSNSSDDSLVDRSLLRGGNLNSIIREYVLSRDSD